MRYYQTPFRLALVIAGCTFATVCYAETLHVQTPALYDTNARVDPKIKDECRVEHVVSHQVAANIRKTFSPIMPFTALSDVKEGKALGLTIISVEGIGGGAWTGPKGINVTVSLQQDGKIVDTFSAFSETSGGMMAGYKSTCSILNRAAAGIGKKVDRWLKDGKAAGSSQAAASPDDLPEPKPEAAK